MHLIGSHVEGSGQEFPEVAREQADEILPVETSENTANSMSNTKRNDSPHVQIVLNGIRKATSALLQAGVEAVHSSTNSIAGSETGIELSFYQRRLNTEPREGFSTAPTLYSRSSTPPGHLPQETLGGTSVYKSKVNTDHDKWFTRLLNSVRQYWNDNISVKVPGRAARDHLGMSTFSLSYHLFFVFF